MTRLSPTQGARFVVDKTIVYVEVEARRTAKATLAVKDGNAQREGTEAIDVRAMQPGSERMFDRSESTDELNLNLLLGADKRTCLRLQWTRGKGIALQPIAQLDLDSRLAGAALPS